MRSDILVCCAAAALSLGAPLETRAAVFDVKTFGAKADGTTPDRDAINKAIDAAAAGGGGTGSFPARTYLPRSTTPNPAQSPWTSPLGKRYDVQPEDHRPCPF